MNDTHGMSRVIKDNFGFGEPVVDDMERNDSSSARIAVSISVSAS